MLEEVRVECFMLCDGAQESNGKLYVLGGGWNTLHGQMFPLTHPQLALAIRLSIPWNDTNRPHPFRIQLIDEDGRDILPKPLEGSFNVGRPTTVEPGDDLPVLLAITMVNTTFPQPGSYTFRLLIDDVERARTSLRARSRG